MKLCKHCIFISDHEQTSEAKCNRPECIISQDVVDGSYIRFSCYEAREREDLCGRGGRWFGQV